MKRMTKFIIGLVVALCMVLITVMSAMATCPECNKGGFIEADNAVAPAVGLISEPYNPVVVFVGTFLLVWVGHELYMRLKK